MFDIQLFSSFVFLNKQLIVSELNKRYIGDYGL